MLEQDQETQQRLERVSRLIEGYETPYGLKMLATLHWAAHYDDPQAAVEVEAAIAGVQAWNARKQRLFKPSHLRKAWQRLSEQGWLVI